MFRMRSKGCPLCSSIGCGGLKIWLFVTSRFEDGFIVYILYNSRIDFIFLAVIFVA